MKIALLPKTNFDFKADFLNPSENKLQIGTDSAAKGTGNAAFSAGTSDILGNSRGISSDMGAYNFIIFEED